MNWLREADAEPIPGYRLIEPLGTGGFGEVWKCEVPGGLFKAIMALHHKVIPPTIKIDSPNPALELEKTPFYLPTQPKPVRRPRSKTS